MTKMDMVWISVATLIHPQTNAEIAVTKDEIERMVLSLFNETITPVMINSHLINSVDRQADQANPRRGGSRNRYLFRVAGDRFRLYKTTDQHSNAWDKTGPSSPIRENIDDSFHRLIDWYINGYIDS